MMSQSPAAGRVARFGAFEIDLRAGELHKNGLKVKIQDKPFQVLSLLLEHPGEIVTREELQERLWPDGTFVDFEHGLNVAVKKLREALGDDPDNPGFVETLPRRGYRFIAPVNGLDAAAAAPAPQPRGRTLFARRWWVLLSASLGTIAAVALTVWLLSPPAMPRVIGWRQLTFSSCVAVPAPSIELFSSLFTDGSRIYFSRALSGKAELAYVSTSGGEEVPLPTPFEWPELLHLSPDGSTLLVRDWRLAFQKAEVPLWLIPTTGGPPRKLGDIEAHAGAWSPDGEKIVFARGQDLYLANSDSSEERKLVSLPGRAFWLRWSPDGKRLRFTLVDPQTARQTPWEVSANGQQLQPLALPWKEPDQLCCGIWAGKGRYFLFRRYHDNRADYWVIRNEKGFPGQGGEPVLLAAGGAHTVAAVESADGKKLFLVGNQPSGETLKYNLKTRTLTPFFPELSRTEFSRDGQWMAYIRTRATETVLWRSRSDGSEPLQLTLPPMNVFMAKWSPDGREIAFMGKHPGQPWKIYLVSAAGGTPRPLLPEGSNQSDPQWSPDGQSIMFGRTPEFFAEAGTQKAIYIFNLKTQQLSKLPGSDGLFSPRWSPDGRRVVAMPLDMRRLMLFDFATGKWSELTRHPMDGPFWAPDARSVYFNDKGRVMRVGLSDRRPEEVLDSQRLRPDAGWCGSDSLTPGGELLVDCLLPGNDIYAMEWEVP